MKKVKGIAILKCTNKTWELKLPDQKRITQECLEQWHKTKDAQAIELSFEIKSKFQFKTQSQLGYIFASVKPTIVSWFRDQGNEQPSIEIWKQVKSAVDFTEQKVSPVDGEKYWDVRSLADASKEDVSDFIDRVIRWAGEWAINIETPEDYKKRMGIDDFK